MLCLRKPTLPGTNLFSGVPIAPSSATQLTLPSPTERHAVLLQDRLGFQRTVLSMHRMPFWLVDRSGAQHAIVMYVAS